MPISKDLCESCCGIGGISACYNRRNRKFDTVGFCDELRLTRYDKDRRRDTIESLTTMDFLKRLSVYHLASFRF